jgi:hypothetical protein
MMACGPSLRGPGPAGVLRPGHDSGGERNLVEVTVDRHWLGAAARLILPDGAFLSEMPAARASHRSSRRDRVGGAPRRRHGVRGTLAVRARELASES